MGEKSKKQVVSKVNLIPTSNNMITTAYLVKQNTNIYMGKVQPALLNVQQVVAVGPRVEDVKVGDWVYLDFSRFIKHVKTQSTIKAGIGGQDMIKETFAPPIFVPPGDLEGAYLKISDREHDGVIEDFESLPPALKEYMTSQEFEEAQKKAEEEAEVARRKQVKEEAEAAEKKRSSKKYKNAVEAPAVFAEGKYRG